MFQLLSGHLQAIKIHETEMLFSSLFLWWYIEISICGCYSM